jgi:5'-nucleotidase
MRALVTNDDGIDSVGLRQLASVAVEAGLQVIVAAPDGERSGSSASLSALEAGGRLVMSERSIDGLEVSRVLAIRASPAMIAFVAAYGAFGPAPDIVICGINHGPNTGYAVLHSGTVGAALTAASHGRRALAVSLAAAEPSHWDTARSIADRALRWWLAHGEDGLVLSVNVPDLPPQRLRGLRPATLAAVGAVQAEVGKVGEGFVTVTFSGVDVEEGSDTDASLLAAGWATATVLRAPCQAGDIDLSGF